MSTVIKKCIRKQNMDHGVQQKSFLGLPLGVNPIKVRSKLRERTKTNLI